MKTHRTTEEEMEGPILFWGYKEQESNLILPEHDDDDDDNYTQQFHDVTFINPLIESMSVTDCIYGHNTLLPKNSTTK
jgi:hypothetical protein